MLCLYPPTDVSTFPYESPLTSAASMESLMLGMNVALNKEKAMKCCPVSYVTPSAPPFMIFHGTDDSTVPFSQSAELHDLLEKNGCDVTLVAINGAEHADIFLHRKSCGIWWRNFSRINFINRKRLHAVCKKGSEPVQSSEPLKFYLLRSFFLYCAGVRP